MRCGMSVFACMTPASIDRLRALYPDETLTAFIPLAPEMRGVGITIVCTEEDWLLARLSVAASTVVYRPYDDEMCIHGIGLVTCGCGEALSR